MTGFEPPLLSLCIPTYNRAKLLHEALTAIVGEIDSKDSSKIEIVISNNASTDHTVQVCSDFSESHSIIKWNIIHQTESVGADNVQIVTRYANGKYIWILSDDDIVLPGSITTILNAVDNNFDAIIINHTSFSENILGQTDRYFQIKEDRYFYNYNDAAVFLTSMISFLSIICFRSQLVEVDSYNFAFGSSLPQSYMFLDALINSKTFVVLANPVLSTRLNNTGGYQVFEVFIENFTKLIRYGESKGLSKSAADDILRIHLTRFIFPLIVQLKTKSIGSLKPDWKQAKKLLRQYYSRDFHYWLLVFPSLYMKKQVLDYIVSLRNKIKAQK